VVEAGAPDLLVETGVYRHPAHQERMQGMAERGSFLPLLDLLSNMLVGVGVGFIIRQPDFRLLLEVVVVVVMETAKTVLEFTLTQLTDHQTLEAVVVVLGKITQQLLPVQAVVVPAS
jgi:hypothetical protein